MLELVQMKPAWKEAECYLANPNNILFVFINNYKSTV